MAFARTARALGTAVAMAARGAGRSASPVPDRRSRAARARRAGRGSAAAASGALALALATAASAQPAPDAPAAGGTHAAAQAGAPAAAAARPGPRPRERVEINADSIEYERDRDVYIAQGRVHVSSGGRSLQARWAAFGRRTRLGVASGNVEFRDGEQVATARFVQFDVDSLEGVLFGGEIDMGEQGLRIAARELVRTGHDRYRIFDARFTTCRCPEEERAPWTVRAARSDIHVGGYGSSRNASFEVLGVPVLWFPWLMYPVKSDRQSGLLVPDVALGGRNGLGVGLPLFWAARENLNVTFTPRWTRRRGFKQDVELESLWGRDAETRIFGAWAHDDEIRELERLDRRFPQPVDRARFASERYLVTLRHAQTLPGDIALRIDGVRTSDNQYVVDFTDLSEHRRDRFLESTAFAFRHGPGAGRLGFEVASRHADERQSPDNQDRDAFALQRWADVEAQWLGGRMPGPLSWLAATASARYEYFGRPRDPVRALGAPGAVVGRRLFLDTGIDALPGTGDPFEGDGLFQDGEPLADRGHRVDLHPRVALPTRLFGALEWMPEAGYRETLYWSAAQGFAERGVFTARSHMALRFGREYGADAPDARRSLEHQLVPRLDWVWISRRNQSQNPLFVPPTSRPEQRLRQLELDTLVLDRTDRLVSTHRIVLGLDQRLYRGRGLERRLAGELGLALDWDFESDGVGRFIVEGRRLTLGRSQTRFHVVLDAGDGTIDDGLVETSLSLPWGVSTSLRYRYLRKPPLVFEDYGVGIFTAFDRDFDRIDQLAMNLRVPFLERWAATYHLRYSFDGSIALTNAGALEYVSKCRCWAFGVELSRSRDEDLRVRFRYTLLGFGDDAQNPFAGGRGWFDPGR